MNENIKNKLELLPLKPGCYLMKDQDNRIIYVGKAKKLKPRVSSYFNRPHEGKTQLLVSNIVDFEYILTDTEKEALILEINLIKEHKPQYNIMFTDDSYYPYLQLTNEKYPRLRIVRDAKNKKATHFGPFPNSTAAHATLKLLNKLYPLRKCERMPNKECLYFHIHQCLGPCINNIDPTIYEAMKKDIQKFLQGDTRAIIEDLTNKMLEASENLEFERALEYKNLITNINETVTKQKVALLDHINRDVMGYVVENGYLSIQIFLMRDGKIIERNLNILPLYDEVEETIESFLMQFYEVNTKPQELLIAEELVLDALKASLDLKLVRPKIGPKKQLLDLASRNASELLAQQFQLQIKKENATINAIKELGALLNMPIPLRIEAFDISHHAGQDTIGGMVVVTNGELDKKEYRKFKITSATNDDYQSMYEVLYRRYYRVLANNLSRPDLIVVDGGKGQIAKAKEVLLGLNLDIKVVGLVKDDTHNTASLMDENYQLIEIDKTSSLFYFLVRLQDEVHRYAISYHRTLKSKSVYASIFDQVEGIGPNRKKLLLKEFKSVANLKKASVEDLARIVPLKVAKMLYEVLANNSLSNE